MEIYEIQKRGAKKAGVQYNGVQKSRVTVRSTIQYTTEDNNSVEELRTVF